MKNWSQTTWALTLPLICHPAVTVDNSSCLTLGLSLKASQLSHLWNGDSCISPVNSALLDVTIAAAPNCCMSLPDTFCCCPVYLSFRSYPLAAHLCPASWLPQKTARRGVPAMVFPWPCWLIWLQADTLLSLLFLRRPTARRGSRPLLVHMMCQELWRGLGDPSCKLLHTVFSEPVCAQQSE